MTYETIEGAQQALTDQFIDREGVSGTAIGACDGNPCIKIYVVGSDAAVVSEIPETFGGFPVDVEVTGVIRPLDADTAPETGSTSW